MKPQIKQVKIYDGITTVTVTAEDENRYRRDFNYSIDLRRGLSVEAAVAQLKELAATLEERFVRHG